MGESPSYQRIYAAVRRVPRGRVATRRAREYFGIAPGPASQPRLL